MNDVIILNNYLLVLKSNVEVYVHGTLESSYNDTRKILKNALDKTMNMQKDTFDYLVNLKAYKVENTNISNIKKVLNIQ